MYLCKRSISILNKGNLWKITSYDTYTIRVEYLLLYQEQPHLRETYKKVLLEYYLVLLLNIRKVFFFFFSVRLLIGLHSSE